MKIFWRTFQVEKIVGYRVQDGKELYRVRWAGFNEEDDTWEPYENLNDACRLMIKDMFGRFPDDLKLDSCKQVRFLANFRSLFSFLNDILR